MCPLDRLEIEVEDASVGVRTDGGVARISEWTGLAIAEPCDIVLVTAKCLCLGRKPARSNVSRRIRDRQTPEKVALETDLSLKEQNCWLITCQTISSEDMAKQGVIARSPLRGALAVRGKEDPSH